jgi:hypothetical protein
MFNPTGLVSISLGSVLLDRPDQTGRFFAKDVAGGWAYLVGDAEGDNLWRGQGVCEGGLDLTLWCAFMSAVNRVPECRQIRILVETRQAHRMMVQLAVNDPRVAAAIAGRPVSVLTRPDAKSSYHVRNAAERAASAALRDREHADWTEARAEATTQDAPNVVTEIPGPGLENRDLSTMRAWRMRVDLIRSGPANAAAIGHDRFKTAEPGASTRSVAVGRLFDPIMNKARDGMVAAGWLSQPRASRNRAVRDWLEDLDSHVEMVTVDLQDVGA